MHPFRVKADGGDRLADRDEIRHALSTLLDPEYPHELRALPSQHWENVTLADLDAAVEAACRLAIGHVYYSLNPIKKAGTTASTSRVHHRRWLLVDIDPEKPVEFSSTQAEKDAALALACAVVDRLTEAGWPVPLVVDSGNGWHLLYRTDLPNDKLSQQLVQAVLNRLAAELNNDAARIDLVVHDAPRIAKLPGTWARKGPNTPERPHRPCRIHCEPETLEVVSVELIRDFAHPPKPKKGTKTSFKAEATVGTKDGYVRTAVDRECLRVALAPGGDRNNTLNDAAFRLGTLAHFPEASGLDIPARLLASARQVGLPEPESLATIRSGWEAGKLKPRERPKDEPTAGKSSAPNPDEPLTIRGNKVVPEKVQWIWQDVIAFNFMNLFAGRTGVGKSFILCDVAARLSKGLPMPDGTGGGVISNTLFISEDPYQYVLVPRLIELGADLSRIGFMTWKAMSSFTMDNTEMLERAWLECDRPVNVVIDPPANFLGKADDHRNAETRAVLMKVVEWLESRHVAISLVTHFNKGGTGKSLDAIYRVMASVAWGSTSRVACACEVDPDDPTRCIFGGLKSNVGAKAKSLGYKIEATENLAKIVWLGPVETTLDDAVNKVKKKSRAENATEWLEERFREQRSWPSTDLYTLGKPEGVSRNAIWEAAQAIPKTLLRREQIHPQDGGRNYWQWTAAPGWPPEKKEEEESAKNVGTLGTLERCPVNPVQDKEFHSVPRSEESWNADSSGTLTHRPSVPASQNSEKPGTLCNSNDDKDLPGQRPSVPCVPEETIVEMAWEAEARRQINDAFSPSHGLTRAIRYLSGMLGRDPVPKSQLYGLAIEMLMESDDLDRASEILGVTRTIDDGAEMWSIVT